MIWLDWVMVGCGMLAISAYIPIHINAHRAAVRRDRIERFRRGLVVMFNRPESMPVILEWARGKRIIGTSYDRDWSERRWRQAQLAMEYSYGFTGQDLTEISVVTDA